jgi:hypothetical protein
VDKGTKGGAIKPDFDYMRSRWGEDTWQRVVASLPEADKVAIEDTYRGAAFPFGSDTRLCEAYREQVFAGSTATAGAAFREVGRHAAEQMLEGAFSVFARFVTMEQALLRSGSIIASAYTGVTAEASVTPGGKSGTVIMRGFDGLAYSSPRIAGWMEGAMPRFGAKNPSVRERTWEAGAIDANELVFDLTWE